MSKLDRYIGTNVLWAILAVLGVLTGLIMLFALVDEMGEVEGTYGIVDALLYVLLTMPRRIYEIIPMAAMIGCLIGLGSLASSSELTVMRAAGISLARIVFAVMKPMLVLMLTGVLIGEYVAPVAEDMAQAGRSKAQGGAIAQSSKSGLWHRQGNEFIHINSVQPNGVLLGVTRYQFDETRRLLSASFAQQAQYQDQTDRWLLKDIVSTHFKEQQTELSSLPEQLWEVSLSPHLLSVVVVEPEALSIEGLWDYIHYLTAQNLNTDRYWLAFWTKTLQPIVTMALVLMAISFIFGPLRSVTLGQRIFTGVVVGFVFYIVQELLGPASQVFGFSPLIAVLGPATGCAIAGCWLLRKAG